MFDVTTFPSSVTPTVHFGRIRLSRILGLDHYPAVEQFAESAIDYPRSVQKMTDAIQDVSNSHGIVPLADDDDDHDGRRARITSKKMPVDWACVLSKNYSALGRPIAETFLDSLQATVIDGRSRLANQATQNELFHWPLMRLALKNSPFADAIFLQSRTSVPFIGTPYRLDYAFVLELDRHTEVQLREMGIAPLVLTKHPILALRPPPSRGRGGDQIGQHRRQRRARPAPVRLPRRADALRRAARVRRARADFAGHADAATARHHLGAILRAAGGASGPVLAREHARWPGDPKQHPAALSRLSDHRAWIAQVFRPWFNDNIFDPLLNGDHGKSPTACGDECFSWSAFMPVMTQLLCIFAYASSPSRVFMASFISNFSGTSTPRWIAGRAWMAANLEISLEVRSLQLLVIARDVGKGMGAEKKGGEGEEEIPFRDRRKGSDFDARPLGPVDPAEAAEIRDGVLGPHEPEALARGFLRRETGVEHAVEPRRLGLVAKECFSWSAFMPVMTQLLCIFAYASSPSRVFMASFISNFSGTSTPRWIAGRAWMAANLEISLEVRSLQLLVIARDVGKGMGAEKKGGEGEEEIPFRDRRKGSDFDARPLGPVDPAEAAEIRDGVLGPHEPEALARGFLRRETGVEHAVEPRRLGLVAGDGVGDFLGGVAVEVVGLALHGPDAAGVSGVSPGKSDEWRTTGGGEKGLTSASRSSTRPSPSTRASRTRTTGGSLCRTSLSGRVGWRRLRRFASVGRKCGLRWQGCGHWLLGGRICVSVEVTNLGNGAFGRDQGSRETNVQINLRLRSHPGGVR
nr:hypothetical protein CFP56_19502 [Quercus suber]